MLAGPLSVRQFSGLRPRVVWDRVAGRVEAPRRCASTSRSPAADTIPDRGLFGVFLPDGKRVGELDEEMVYESRVGEAFVLGATTWRIEEITFDRVVVTPAPGEPAKTPFWSGDKPGRPLELGRAMGALVRELRRSTRPMPRRRSSARAASTSEPPSNLLAYLSEQAEATGGVPDDRTIVIERFADEIGDWRVCILTPFGARVHAPWALAIEEQLARNAICRSRRCGATTASSAGCPKSLDEIPLDVDLLVDPEELDELVVSRVPSTSLFSSRFRENAARALLLPRRRPGERTPLWQQRQRAAGLLDVAAGYPTFPILLETTASACATSSTCPRSARCSPTCARARCAVVPVDTPRRVAVRAVAALRLDRGVHVRRRRAAGRAPGCGPRARPRPAARAARRRGAARVARPGGDRRARARAATPHTRTARPRADDLHDLLADLGDPSTTKRSRLAPTARRRSGRERLVETPPRDPRADRRRGTAGCGRRRGAAARDALGVAIPAGLAGCLHRSRSTAPRRPRCAVRPHARPLPVAEVVARSVPPTASAVRAASAASSRRSGGARRVPARGTGRSSNGATRAYSGACGGARSRRCATRSSRSTPATFVRFLSGWHGIGRGRRGTTRWSRRSNSSRALPSRSSVLERDVSPHASRATGPPCSTSCARQASWCGPVPARSAPTTGACGCSSVTACGSSRRRGELPEAPDGPLHDAIRDALAAWRSFWPDYRGRRRYRRRSRAAHRAVGSRMGGRAHQRHLRPTARTAPQSPKRSSVPGLTRAG